MSAELFTGVYDFRLVLLSVLVAVIAACCALDLLNRATSATGVYRDVWIAGGSSALGLGLWAADILGVAARTVSKPVLYDWPTVAASTVAAMLASAIALITISRPTKGWKSVPGGSLVMGGGITAMHYLGLAAMRGEASYDYSAWLVVLSVAATSGIAYGAFTIPRTGMRDMGGWTWRKFTGAVLLGMTIPIVHSLGRAAVMITPANALNADLSHAVHFSIPGLLGIAGCSLFILTLVMLACTGDRRRDAYILELNASRLLLQAVLDHISDGILVVDAQQTLVMTNRAGLELLGLTQQNAADAGIAGVHEILSSTGDSLPVEQWPVSKAMRGEFLRKKQDFVIRRKGVENDVHVEVLTAPILDREGRADRILFTYRDVTELKVNTATRARLATIVDSSQDAIVSKDHTGIVKTWNASAERIFGYTAEEMVGQSIMKLIPPEREHEEVEFLTRIRRGEYIRNLETVRRTRSGKLIHVSLTISPIVDEAGKVIGVSKIARDISPHKQLERQLRQSQKMEAIGQLTGGIAHDFNNLLGVVVGNLELAEHLMGSNESALNFLRSAGSAAMRGADLTRRLLAFSSTEDLQPAPTNLSCAIRNTIALAGRTLGPEIVILMKLTDNIPDVLIDPSALENALLNLAVNARDAMPKGGTLTFSSELNEIDDDYSLVQSGQLQPGRYVSVSVTDTGCGMSRETLERAFEPFFTTKARGKGTGLGLAMVYGFVKQSGGAIRIYSEVGFGTTVVFYLKLAEAKPEPAPMAPPPSLAGITGCRVLIVDDEPELLEIAATYVMELGCMALQARDGGSALALFEREKDTIDLVITDVVMPKGMNGVELIENMRLLKPGIRVIYSSGFAPDVLKERSGAVVEGQLLRKPYRRADFAAMVRRAILGDAA